MPRALCVPGVEFYAMKNFLYLPFVLRSVSALIVVAVALQYFLLAVIVAVPVIAVIILLALSFTFEKWPRTSAAMSLLPGLLVPILVLIGYLNDTAPTWLLLFDWMIFSWVVASAINVLFLRNATDDKEIDSRQG